MSEYEYEFTKQRVAEHISTGDEIVIFNSEEGENGPWKVADVMTDGEVLLVGLRRNEGCIMQINMAPTGEKE